MTTSESENTTNVISKESLLGDLVNLELKDIADSKVTLEKCGTCTEVVVRCHAQDIVKIVTILKNSSQLKFDLLVDVTAIDWLDSKEERFEMVYHLLSISKRYRLRIKTKLTEAKPEIETLTGLYKSANWQERETYDMYGIKFTGHPDLRRILLYEEFVGHPLRKDYPVQGKQPRVVLRASEVRNTATDMRRPPLAANFEPLVTIGKRRSLNPSNTAPGVKKAN